MVPDVIMEALWSVYRADGDGQHFHKFYMY
jgi:hypothetical protein